jgi:GAF domain-containing protein
MIQQPFIYTSLITITVALITAILGPIIVLWVKDKIIDKSKTPTPMAEAINLNALVDDQVETILEELECDRVWIAQFHNGGNFYPTGKSIQKFSIFYEKLTLNSQSIQSLLQNIPASLFSKALSQLHKEGELSIPDVESGSEIYGLESISSQIHAKSLYMVGLYSLDNHLIGIMCIAYNAKQHKLTKDEWIYIRQKIGVIGTLLTEYLYANPIKK